MHINLLQGNSSKQLTLAIIIMLVSIIYISYPAYASPPRVFYVSKNAPPGGDGHDWAHAFNELDQIDWNAVQDAIWDNLEGGTVPGEPNKVQAIVEVDGGPDWTYMIYKTPLHPTCHSAGSPYEFNWVLRRSNQPGHMGQVIIEGGGAGTAGLPGMDLTDQSGCYIEGNNFGWNGWFGGMEDWWAMQAVPGILVTRWCAGLYMGGSNYAGVSGCEFDGNGVNILAAKLADIPNQTVGGQRLRVNPDQQAPIFGAGQGLHILWSWITNPYDRSYHANAWVKAANYGAFEPGHHFPYGYPEFMDCLINDCQNPGINDGVYFGNAEGQTGYHTYLFRRCIIGSGLKRGIVLEQDNITVFAHGCLFINPSEANITKRLAGDENCVYMAHCISAMTHLNAAGHAHAFVDMVEAEHDRITSCVIDGGAIRINGTRALGPNIERSRTTGNGVLLSQANEPSRLATDFSTIPDNTRPMDFFTLDYSAPEDSAAYQSSPWTTSFRPWTSVDAYFGLPLGTRTGRGFAPGYVQPPVPSSEPPPSSGIPPGSYVPIKPVGDGKAVPRRSGRSTPNYVPVKPVGDGKTIPPRYGRSIPSTHIPIKPVSDGKTALPGSGGSMPATHIPVKPVNAGKIAPPHSGRSIPDTLVPVKPIGRGFMLPIPR